MVRFTLVALLAIIIINPAQAQILGGRNMQFSAAVANTDFVVPDLSGSSGEWKSWVGIGHSLYRATDYNGTVVIFFAWRDNYYKWHYERVHTYSVGINLESDTFYSDIVKYLEHRETSAEKLAVLKSLGIKVSGEAERYITTGSSVIYQGVFPGGQTLQGYSATSVYAPIDPAPLIRESQRLVGRTLDLTQEANAGANELVKEATKAEQIRAAGEANARSIEALNDKKVEVQQWRKEPAPPQTAPPDPKPDPVVDPSTKGASLQIHKVNGLAVARARCAPCHFCSRSSGRDELEAECFASVAA